MNLKLGIQRVGSIVFGRVLEQDKNFDIVVNQAYTSIINSIESLDTPELSNTTLFVRGGRKANDNNWFARDYITQEIAEEVVDNIKSLVKWANSEETVQEVKDCGMEIVE